MSRCWVLPFLRSLVANLQRTSGRQAVEMSVGAVVQLVYSVSVWWSPDITALCISLDVDELLVSKNRQTVFVPLLQALEIKPISYYYSPSPRLIPFNNF
jgi:hypothetical protein